MLGKIRLVAAFSLFLGAAATLPAQTPQLEIWEVQGNDASSPYLGQFVECPGNVVTVVGDEFFFVQTPDERSDHDPATSDGLYLYTGTPPGLQVGDVVDLSGIVREYLGNTEMSVPNLSYELTGSQAPVPAPAALTPSYPAGLPGPVHELERFENMRATFTAQVTGPSNSYGWAALSTRPERPFREPGIKYPGQSGLPVWDGNPEIFYFDPNGLSAPNNRFLSYGMQVSATAVFLEDEGDFLALPVQYTATGSANEQAVRPRMEQEITVGSLNCLLFFSDDDDFSTRVRKLARFIIERMQAPDILALQEVGDLNALQELA
ncbi:MAG: hypothetical protein KDC54_08310, partial [Lewinella sp.]|nr:hypothetical protein [Lewinella sp.]